MSRRWLFGRDRGARDRVALARRHLEDGRPDLARAEVVGLEDAEAREILRLAEAALARRRLDEAVEAARAGDDALAADRLALAEQLEKGSSPAHERARRAIRRVHALRAEVEERSAAERRARATSVDPLGLSGPSFAHVAPPALEVEPTPAEIDAKLAAAAATWPEEIRARAGALGPSFARAVLDLEEGRPEDALRALLALPDDEPIVVWERARASAALGDDEGAARLLRTFARLFGRHVHMGGVHTGVLLAELTARAGDPHAALRTLRDVRATEPHAAEDLLAELLRRTGQTA